MRYLNPYTASFLIRDTYIGQLVVPLSQNRYAYVHKNPMMYTDPSGHTPYEEGLAIYGMYLFRNGELIYVNDWGEYMMSNDKLTDKTEQYIIPIGQGLREGETIVSKDKDKLFFIYSKGDRDEIKDINIVFYALYRLRHL